MTRLERKRRDRPRTARRPTTARLSRVGSRLGSRAGSWAGALAACLLGVVACDGGGGGEAPVAAPLTAMEASSRFLAQATLGADLAEIEYAERLGFESWIDEQLALPASSHLEEMRRLELAYGDPGLPQILRSPFYRRLAWWSRVMSAPDTLRQRVAMALSEIFVVSEVMDALAVHPEAVASYYDVLLEHAFGSYEALLLDVTLHPAMGVYLSHLNNDRSDPVVGRFPDENYAREVMQLFSIGLFELAPDGSLLRDVAGDPIPTYGNDEVTELAKVFTGLGLQGPGAFFGAPFLAPFGAPVGDRTRPMIMYDAHHEPGPKRLLDGFVLPAGQSGMQDVEAAVAQLASHPNVGPFLARRLIQRLVKSNPSPGYIERVARVFDDDGAGVRGNLGAVVRAVLLDGEARRDPGDVEDGRLREPFLRWVALLRAFDARAPSGEYLIDGTAIGVLVGQHPMASPSVFNFFQPDFAPNGPVKQAGLVAPEFQVTTDASVVWIANLATYFLFIDAAFQPGPELFRPGSVDPDQMRIAFDFSALAALANDPAGLLDRLDLLLTYGTLSTGTRAEILRVLESPGIDDAELRVRLAIHFLLMSPDYAVVR